MLPPLSIYNNNNKGAVMWILTPVGFFSIVHKEEDDGELTIRARTRADLTALRQKYIPTATEILETHDSDYKYRIFASRAAIGNALARMAEDIDYRNFKQEIAEKHGRYRANIYGSVWSLLYRLQEDENP